MAPADRRVIIPYAPRGLFLPYHLRKQRFAAMVAHRRCGKTVACVNDLIKRTTELKLSHGRLAYVAPLLGQAKDVAWDYLKRFAAPIITAKNEGELWVELLGQHRIRVYGADNPDRLRGAYLDGVILDEFADMRPSVWGEIIRPMLADRKGWATFIGTPKGRNAFFDKFKEAEADPEHWFSGIYRASETRILDADELASARRDMTLEEFEQEFECSFDAAIKGAYFGKEIAEAERTGHICIVDRLPGVEIQTAWDLGIGDSTAIWVFQVVGSEVRIIDYYENAGFGLEHYAEWLEARGYVGGRDWVPHDARVRELGTGKTRLETLAALGRKPELVPAHKVDDGINAARLLFNRCWFNVETTADGVEALRQYREDYDEKRRAFSGKPRHDWTSHCADAFRYLAMAWQQQAPAPTRPDRRTLGPLTQGIGAPIDRITLDEFMDFTDDGQRSRYRI